MKQNATNEFRDGLNLDLHPIVTPNTVLTDNLNGTFITYNGNEFCLQNDRGNKQVASLTSGYTPIGIKEHNGILYIVSVNGNTTEIGTFPSPDWNIKNGQLNPNYSALHNYYRKETETRYCIWSYYDTDEMNESGIDVDLSLLESICGRYNIFETGNIFGDNHADYLYSLDESQRDSLYNELNVAFPGVFGKKTETITYDGDLSSMRFISKYTIKTPVTIEIQDSYDGSVNLILVADQCPTRIINTAFSVKGNEYEIIDRNQSIATNYYSSDKFDEDTELIRTSNVLTNIDLLGVQSGGQFKGGNYTFYIKFGDADYNQTDVVAESGIVSIFNGNDGVPSTISGTLADERTDKMIHLAVTGLNHVYSKIYIYYSREYSDTQGFRMTEYGMFNEPIDMIQKEDEETFESGEKGQSIWLTGFEQTSPIDSEILNVDYHTVDWARAEAQHSNMLFLGNVGQKETFDLYHKLEKYTCDENNVICSIERNALIDVEPGDNFSNRNYYSTKNIYYSLGYWPNEWYRFGIVYILKDGSTTPVFNVPGGIFVQNGESYNFNYTNKKGVFKTPDLNLLATNNINALYFKFKLLNINELDDRVIGWFVVRQKRIPTTICQALAIGTDKRSHLPVIWTEYFEDSEIKRKWYIESFLSLDRTWPSNTKAEKWDRKGAQVLQVEGEPHILRPFLQNFEGSNIRLDDGTITADYLATTFSFVYRLQISSLEEFERRIFGDDDNPNPLSQYGFDPNNDLLALQQDIRNCWDNLNFGEMQNILIWKSNVYGKKQDDGTYQPVDQEVFYILHTFNSLDENYISTDIGTIYVSSEELFPSQNLDVSHNKLDYRFIIEKESEINKNALLSLDPCVNSFVKGYFNGSEFTLKQEYAVNSWIDNLVFNYDITHKIQSGEQLVLDNTKTVFVGEQTKWKVVDDNSIFSNLAGSPASAGDFAYTKSVYGVKTDNKSGRNYYKDDRINDKYGTSDYYGYNSTHNVNLVRGLFTPYIGINKMCEPGLYSISVGNISDDGAKLTREQDDSEYYCVSKRLEIVSGIEQEVYRGDCYICKVGMRVLKNFVDNTAPVTSTIVDPLGWERWVRQRSLYGGDSKDKQNGGNDVDSWASIVDYSEVNLSDLNAIDLGYWVTFPCLSSYNLGLRSLDTFHTDEMALLGSPRSFYPLSGASAINKVGDSYLLNDGLSATVGRKRYNLMPDVPYSKSEFANRIMFSNVNITDAFTNGYRTFQGLSYKDYDKQYGAITKLISLGQNIFVVMEHGLGLVPVNPKALMQTTTGEAIHIYGYGVLPDEMTIISQDYGSKYEHSVIRTPIGIYGIDVDAKKIWRFSDKQGFETISDMKIETYLKDNLKSQEIEMGSSDIRTHYNGKKGDLMFTWYHNGEIYSICYNERQNLWVTRYDWTPIVSENINDEFYSLNIGKNDTDYSIWDHHYEIGKENEYVSTWYDNNKGFEFEFVVSDPIGINKIFENLQIISNNVSPEELQITIIGDDYTFKRDEITPNYERKEYPDNITWTTSNIHENDKEYRELENTVYKWDWRLHQMAIVNTQKLRDIYKHGRRLGNMQYKNGMWFIQIDPLRLNINVPQQKKEVRIRDKWAKIRIRYSGKDLAIITAIRTLINV